MPYKKGDVLKLGEYRMRVLEVLGDLYFLSSMWNKAGYAERYSKLSARSLTEYQLSSSGWSLCPTDQTLLPAEKWVPKEGEKWFFGYVTSDGEACANFSQMSCEAEAKIGNVHKTSEEAIEWACKRYGITKP